ncbi:MAG TPA: hypothetical protein PKB14_08180 [Rubrivivax sp.]|nr:hypothetical protein [Rubrivivax sp.]
MTQYEYADAPALPFSFNRQGPFYRLQRKLGLLSDTELNAARRGLLFALLAWLPVIVLAALQGVVLNAEHERSALHDFSIHAAAIAIFAFVLMEASSERRMAWLVTQFVAHDIVGEESRARFAALRLSCERRTGSWLAETAVFIAAGVLSFVWVTGAEYVPGGTWFGHVAGGELQLTWAGWWVRLVVLPLFWFLLGRWLWRFGVWAMMLRGIARSGLRLVATHPDRCGGIAFIGQYPNTYLLFVFALSTVASASVLKLVVYGGVALSSFKFAAAGLLVFVLAVFVAPLFAFMPLLVGLKRHGLTTYGALVGRHHRAFEAKWGHAAASAPGDELLGAPDMSSLADIAASYEAVKNMLPVPVTKESLVPLTVAVLLPMAAVAATRAPFKQILDSLKGLLLL